MQAQMLNLNTSMNRVNQEKLLYENQLRIFREQLSALKDPQYPGPGSAAKERETGRKRPRD